MKFTKVAGLVLSVLSVLALAGCAGDQGGQTPSGDTPSGEGEGHGEGQGEGQGGKEETPAAADTYTYHTWSTSLGNKWDPFTWETNADDSMLSYVSSGFTSMAPLSTEDESWQWAFDMAESVEDTTAENKDLLKDLGVKFRDVEDDPETEEVEKLEGYVYDIHLRHGIKFEEKTLNGKKYGGKEVKADDFLESFALFMDPARKNYRANLYYAGETAIAGGFNYYWQGSEGYFAGRTVFNNVYSEANDAELYFVLNDATKINGKKIYSMPGVYDWYVGQGVDYAFICNYIEKNMGLASGSVAKLEGKSLAEIKADAALAPIWEKTLAFWQTDPNEELDYLVSLSEVPETSFESLGLKKVDDYTIRYVCETQQEIKDTFLTHLTSSWLVDVDLYNDLTTTDPSTGLKVSTYGTSTQTTLSYGPYKLVNYEAGKQAKYDRNPNWFGYEKDEKGNLVSYTTFEVDGAKQPQYQTTGVVIDVLTQATAKLAFEKGELNEYSPTPNELLDYTMSSQLYQVDETYTMSFFFDTNLEDLQRMDNEGLNKNGVVMSNINFRKGMSLAINRADWVTNTEGYKPAYSLLNSLYYYDIYNDPASQYRKTDEAMKAIVDLYGVEYGEGKAYATLKEAYESITGFNLDEAKALWKTACEELVQAGLYTAGEDIEIKVAYKKGSLEDADMAQINAMNRYFEAAAEGTGFGKVTLVPLGNIDNRYDDVGAGKYAIGYGAWGGAAFYPFRNFQVYMDPEQYSINEARCWDPTTETKTIVVNMWNSEAGEYQDQEITMTYQQWSSTMVGSGKLAGLPFSEKLKILAELEKDYLGKYYRIPLAGSCASFLLGYQQHYYTEKYNIMYDFGGFRLMVYDYTDAEWAAYVQEQGGTLNYR